MTAGFRRKEADAEGVGTPSVSIVQDTESGAPTENQATLSWPLVSRCLRNFWHTVLWYCVQSSAGTSP